MLHSSSPVRDKIHLIYSRSRLIIIVATLSFCIFPVLAHATTYYVDSAGGSNSNNGISSSTPWQTIAKVNSSTFSPGDSVLFKDGDTWREQLTIPSSGATGTPITFGNYGTGANPTIIGSNVVTSWSLVNPPTPQFSAPLNGTTSLLLGTGTSTFSRASTGTYINAATGYITIATSNTPRYENPGGISSILLEPTSTNLFTYSSAVTNWQTNLATVGTPITGPDGVTANAYPVIPTATSSMVHYVEEPTVSPVSTGTSYTASLYVEPGVSNFINIQVVWLTSGYGYIGSSYAYYNVASGTVITSSDNLSDPVTANIGPLVNGFRRISLVMPTEAGASLATVIFNMEPDSAGDAFVGNGTSAYSYVTDAQLEQSPVATSYISTGSNTSTRASEMGNLTWPTSGNVNSATGTAYLQWYPSVSEAQVATGTYGLLSVNGSSSNLLYHQNTPLIKSFDGTNTATTNLTWAANTWYSLAVTWGGGHMTVYQNGTAGVSTTYSGSFSPGAAISLLTGNAYPAHIATVKLWNTVLNATQIQNMNTSGGTYVASLTSTPSNVYVDSQSSTVASPGIPLTAATSITNVNSTLGSWYYSTSTQQIYIQLSDASNPSGHTIEASVRQFGIESLGHSFITVQNFNVKETSKAGIDFENSGSPSGSSSTYYNNNYNEFNTIQGNTTWNIGGDPDFEQAGIFVNGVNYGASGIALRGWTITNNTIGRMNLGGGNPGGINYAASGINVFATQGAMISSNTIATVNDIGLSVADYFGSQPCSSPTIIHNVLTNNITNIRISSCPSPVITYNIVHDSNGFGIGLGSGDTTLVTNAILAYNLIYNLQADYGDYNGIDINDGSTNGIMENNTISQVAVHDATLEGDGNEPSNGWTVRNNMFDCRNNQAVYGYSLCFYIAGDVSTSTLTFDNNIWSLPSSTALGFEHPISTEINYSQFEALTEDTNSQNVSDPLFVSTSSANFKLQAGSPAINAGTTITGFTTDLAGMTVPQGSAFDAGAYEYVATSTPAITWLAPTNGSAVSSTITLSASSTAVSPASISSVQFYLNGSPLGAPVTATSSPNTYSYSWSTLSTANGTKSLYALATDNYGNTASSSPISLTVANPATLSVPTSTLTFSAVHGSTATSSQSVVIANTAGTSTVLNWSASSTQSWLTFSPASSSANGGATTSLAFVVNPTGLSIGTDNATATISASGATGSPQYVPVSFTISTTGISAVLLLPTAGATVTSTITLSASATSTAGITQVQYYLDGSLLGSASSSPYTFSWNTNTASDGSHTLEVLATDALSNAASSSISLTVDNTPPLVSITSPSNGGTVSGTTSITASSSDGVSGISSVVFYLDGSLFGTSTSSPYTISWNTTQASNGTHNLSAVATDGVGNATTSAVVSVVVNNVTPPSPVVSAGGGGSTYSLAIDNGVATTATPSVTLSLYGTGAYTMELSNTSDFSSSTWIPYVTSMPWTLASNTGEQTVFVQYRSISGGIVGSAQASIDLAAAPVQTISSATSTAGMSVSQMQNLLASLEAQLQALQSEASGTTTVSFARNLSYGMTGNSVKALQSFLIKKNAGPAARRLAAHGATTNFGPLTKAALIEFQKSVGIKLASGYFGPITRAYVNAHE